MSLFLESCGGGNAHNAYFPAFLIIAQFLHEKYWFQNKPGEQYPSPKSYLEAHSVLWKNYCYMTFHP